MGASLCTVSVQKTPASSCCGRFSFHVPACCSSGKAQCRSDHRSRRQHGGRARGRASRCMPPLPEEPRQGPPALRTGSGSFAPVSVDGRQTRWAGWRGWWQGPPACRFRAGSAGGCVTAGHRCPIGEVGLDVQQGRAVQHVHMRDVEDVPVPAQQRYQAHADAARTAGGPGGEDAALLRPAVRDDVQARRVCPVEGKEQPDAGRVFQPFKPGREFGEDLHLAGEACGVDGLPGRLGRIGVRVWMMPMGRQVNRGRDMGISCRGLPGNVTRYEGRARDRPYRPG